jgi:hemin uptake protein HemP
MSNQLSLSHQQQGQSSTGAVSVNSLLKGKRYAWISHAGETYLLQLTKSNKLLLTK